MSSHSNFLWYLTSKWGRDIPLKNLWTIHFTDIDRVAQNVSNILYSAENRNSNKKWPILDYSRDQSDEQGLFVSQSIKMPNNSFELQYTSNGDMGGLRAGYVGSQRNVYSEINVEFLETNTDIIDFFFRPWIVAASHKGLIEDNDELTDIKCDAYVSYYGRVNRDNMRSAVALPSWQLRKTFKFEGIVPTNVEGETLRMDSFNTNDFIKSVSFTYKDYHLLTDPYISTIPGRALD